MKFSNETMLCRANGILKSYNQTILITEWTGKHIKFTNGIILLGNKRGRFIKHLFNKKTDIWKRNHDDLFSGVKNESEIKSALAAIGGKSVQEKHGSRMRVNLNNGIPWNKGMSGNYPYRYPCSERAKIKISQKNSGEKNGRYGYKYTYNEKIHKSDTMKEKILKGQFTPNTNNRNTHWESCYNGKKYRSSWEALYQSFNEYAEYEELRIVYKLENTEKVYIVDFIDYVNKVVVEVKPSRLCLTHKNKIKLEALADWAKINGYKLLIADENWFLSHPIGIIPFDKFDNNTKRKIQKLYEINKKN